MAAKKTPALTSDRADNLLKAMLVFSRTAGHVLEDRTVEAAKTKLSRSRVQILRLLGQRGHQTSTRLARFLGVSKPAVTQIIDTMVKDKMVVRKRMTEDRRTVELRLTPRGREVFCKVRDEQRRVIRNAVRTTPRCNPDRWVKALEEITTALAGSGRAFKHFCLQCGSHADGSCVLSGGSADCLFLLQVETEALEQGISPTLAAKKKTTKKKARAKSGRRAAAR